MVCFFFYPFLPTQVESPFMMKQIFIQFCFCKFIEENKIPYQTF